MPDMNDHDLLIRIDSKLNDLGNDVKALSDTVQRMQTSLEQTNERQRDQDNRLTNLTSTVVRIQADQRDEGIAITKLREDHSKEIATLKEEHGRWKLYLKIGAILTTPIYIIILALATEAAKRYFFP